MGRRYKTQSLERVCLVSICRNMDKLWCAEYVKNFHEQGAQPLHVIGPFDCLPSSLTEKLIQCLADANKLKRYHLQLLVDRRLERLDLSICRRVANKDSVVSLVTRRCKGLKSLNLAYCDQVSPQSLIDLTSILPDLMSLNLSFTRCNDQVLRTIGRTCRKLRDLDVEGCGITDSGLESLCQVQTLRRLAVGMMEGTTSFGISSLLSNCPDLVKVTHMELCDAVYMLYESGFRSTLALRSLTLYSVEHASLAAACKLCPNVTEIDMIGSLKDDDLVCLSELQHLSKLNLLVDEALDFQGGLLPFLQIRGETLSALHLDCFREIDVGVMGLCCPTLKHLMLKGGFAVSTDVKKPVFEDLLSLKLTILSSDISGHALCMLLDHAVKLTDLFVCDSESFDDELLVKILEQNPLKNLVTLELENCNNIYLDPIFDFCESNNDLHCLKLLGCKEITRIDKEQLEALVEDDHLDLTIQWM